MFHAASQCRECGSHKTQTVPCYTFATLGSEQKSEKGPHLPLSPLFVIVLKCVHELGQGV